MKSVFRFFSRTTLVLLFVVGSICGGPVFARAGAEGAPGQGGEPGNSPIRSLVGDASSAAGAVTPGNTVDFVEPNCPFVLFPVIARFPVRLERIQSVPLNYTVRVLSAQPGQTGAVIVQKPGGNVALKTGESLAVTLQQWEGLVIYNNNNDIVPVAIYGPCPN